MYIMKDKLGSRMKEQYEDRARYFLPRWTNTIIRLDGKAFHSFTKGFAKPFSLVLHKTFKDSIFELCKGIQGVKIAYYQSDEVSLLLQDFAFERTEAFYNGNIQKIASVSASMLTAYFNKYLFQNGAEVTKLAMFDARVFSIPDPIEAQNYFIWRQKDAIRNSISSLAQSLYSHKELIKKNSDDMKAMCLEKGIDWEKLDDSQKRGRI